MVSLEIGHKVLICPRNDAFYQLEYGSSLGAEQARRTGRRLPSALTKCRWQSTPARYTTAPVSLPLVQLRSLHVEIVQDEAEKHIRTYHEGTIDFTFILVAVSHPFRKLAQCHAKERQVGVESACQSNVVHATSYAGTARP